MQTIKQLKAKYDNQPIKAIEKEAKATQGQAKDVFGNFIEILFYLERTQRYKENRLYKKSTYQQYLSFEYGMLYNTYHEKRLAMSNHPGFVAKYTSQLYSSIKKKCGSDKVAGVIKEIEAKDAKLKRPLDRAGIQKIIDKNRKPISPKAEKPDVKMLKDKVVTFQVVTNTLEKAVLMKDEQIMKLKASVKRLISENDVLKRENKELREAAMPLAAILSDTPDRLTVAVQ